MCDQLAGWPGHSIRALMDPTKRAVRKEWEEHDSSRIQKVTRWENEPFVFIPEQPCFAIDEYEVGTRAFYCHSKCGRRGNTERRKQGSCSARMR